MTPETITLILNIIFISMLVLGFLFGLKGLKKSTSSLISFIVAMIVILFLIGPVTNMILNISINGSTINETILESVDSAFSNSLSSNAVVQALVKGIPAMLVGIVVCFLLIFIIGSIFKLIGSIIYRIIFGKDEKVVEDVKIVNNVPQITKRTVKCKKHRLLGGCVGLVHGFLLAIVMFMPLVGLVNITNEILDINQVSTEQNDETATVALSSMYQNKILLLSEDGSSVELKPAKDLLKENLPDEFYDYAKALDSSIFAKIGKIGNLSEKTLNLVARCNINGYTVKLGEEIKTLVGVYDEFVEFATEASDNLGTTDINIIFEDIADNPNNYDFKKLKSLLDHLFNSNLVKSVGNDGLKFISDSLVENNTNEQIQPMLLHIQTAINNYYLNNYNIKDDAIAMLDVFEISAKSGLIKAINKEDISIRDISDILLNNSESVLNGLCGKISASNLLQKLVIEAINYGSSCLQDFMNENMEFENNKTIEFVPIDGSKDVKITSTELAKTLSCGLKIYKEIDENVDLDEIEDDIYNIFNYDLESLINLAGDGIDSIVNMSIIKNSGLFTSICNAMSNSVEYSKYLSFNELPKSSNIKNQFSIIATSINQLKNSNIISILKNMNDENSNDSISAIINELTTKDANNVTLTSKIISPILSCSILKNTIVFGLDNVNTFIEYVLNSMLDEEISISKFNTSTIQTETGNNQLLEIIEKTLEYAKDINLTQLQNNMMDTLIESDLQKLGTALDAVKTSTLFSSNGTDNGAYADIIDGLNKSDFNSVLDFSVAKSTSFSWESELSTLKNTINTLNEIKVTDKSETSGLVSYLLNGGDFNIAYGSLNFLNAQSLKPLFEISLIKPVAISVINVINDKIKSFVGDDLGASITSFENTIVLKEQEPQQITDIIAASTQIDFNETDLDNINKNELNYLLLKLEENAQIDGVFKESYNALLLKVANMINENVQSFANVEENKIKLFTEATDILEYCTNIRYVLNIALDSIKSIKNATIKTLDTTVLISFVDALKLNSTIANGIFNETYNTILIYIINEVNNQIADYVGETLTADIVTYKGSDESVENIGISYNYIKEIIESAVDAYKSIEDGKELKDIDSGKLSRLLTALNILDLTKPAYNALNIKIANEIILEINKITEKNVNTISSVIDLSSQASEIKNILEMTLEVAPSLEGKDFELEKMEESDKENLTKLLIALQTNGESEQGVLKDAYNSIIEFIEEENSLQTGFIKEYYSKNGKIDWNSFILELNKG